MRKSLLEEVQELEARAVDPGAAVLRDASGRRYIHACMMGYHLELHRAYLSVFILKVPYCAMY